LKYLNKTLAELKQNGTAEEIFKAKLMDIFLDTVFTDEDAIVEFFGEQCPDEVLEAARREAIAKSK